MNTHSDFASRHIGPQGEERREMLDSLGYRTLDELIADIVPADIRMKAPLDLPAAKSETEALEELRSILRKNKLLKTFIGQGYYGTITPSVILRNVLENPGWYTAYTPYQPEIAQGRLEMLMNFQTMVSSLTGLPVANASLLDEGTAAAEAVTMCRNARPKANTFFVADTCHPQTISVIRTRAAFQGVNIIVGDCSSFDPASIGADLAGVLVQYPDTLGRICDYTDFFSRVHATGALCVVAADLMALTVIREPGAFGADICIGNTQRFGIPMGFGGPHAAYMSCTDALKRRMPGRLIGMSIDTLGRPAYRLALQTREQHIRRDKATSNICTAQVLLAVLAAFYAVYHGQEGLKRIGTEIHLKTKSLYKALTEAGIAIENKNFFDTLLLSVPGQADAMVQKALEAGYNIRRVDADHAAISLDETATCADIAALASALAGAETSAACDCDAPAWDPVHTRQTPFCTEKAFNSYHSETEMMRYIRRLESRDLALNEAMIPLGSCTMKLNAASEMIPITWPEANSLHPFVPADQSEGIREMLSVLSDRLAKITGFAAVSLQPNAGAAGEYAGLLAIRRYQKHAGEGHRNVCLIPTSAHGTNPASSAMAGLKVVPVKCDERGNIDMADLKSQAEAHKDNLSCIMVTYPSTHGVYEQTIKELCDIVHANGGQVYMDGANLNAQVGLTRPADIGADVSHMNLHKTFCIPHGGGGPGMGPIGVRAHLAPFVADHPVVKIDGPNPGNGAVSAAPWGSASILPISWMYIAMMGPQLADATEVAILNANYLKEKLSAAYPVLFSGRNGRVAHECIIDIRPLKAQTGISEEDVAKRLMDYGFHAPTMSFPVPGTLMIEPTESESKHELDRFIEAMLSIRAEIAKVEAGEWPAESNPLKGAPHSLADVTGVWERPYSIAEAVTPSQHTRDHKYWPTVNRVDNVYGDRNLHCACVPVDDYR